MPVSIPGQIKNITYIDIAVCKAFSLNSFFLKISFTTLADIMPAVGKNKNKNNLLINGLALF